MAEELGYLLYTNQYSAQEDKLWVCLTAAVDRLAKSKDALDQCVSIALKTEALAWEKNIRDTRQRENDVDRALDDQQ